MVDLGGLVDARAVAAPSVGAPSLRRVGMIGAYVDIDSGWSGTPAALRRGLEALGAETRYLDVTPTRLAPLAHRWLTLVGRADEGWLLRPEAVAAGRVSTALRRIRQAHDIDHWIHLPGPPMGRAVHGHFVTFEDLTVAQMQRLGWMHTSGRRWARWRDWQSHLYRRARACCVATAWTKRSLVDDFGVPEGKIHVVGLGVNHMVAPPVHRHWSSPRFLFVGLDWERKNGDAVLRAFARLRRLHPDARLDLVGMHPEVSAAGVHGHGRLSASIATEREQLRRLYRQATCFVMPSRLEPLGIVYLEAARAGLPVIGSTAGGIRDVLGEAAGLYVDPDDDDALFRAMCRLSDGSEAAAKGSAAARAASSFTWEQVAARVLTALFG